jgi:tetratricopeptide (TPR) repeat protein
MKLLSLLALPVLLMIHASNSAAFEVCGDLQNAYGPFDYWVQKKELEVVEAFHFTPSVESLTRGRSGSLGSDLDYTLRASPNHVRALAAMVNLGAKEKTETPNGTLYSIECYFDRALRFRPGDAMVRVVYANFLGKRGKAAEALKQLELAKAAGVDSGNFNYNLGLAYFDAKEFEQSLESAHRAYKQGFNLPGLKNKLVRAGKWRDPPPVVSPGLETQLAPDVPEGAKGEAGPSGAFAR